MCKYLVAGGTAIPIALRKEIGDSCQTESVNWAKALECTKSFLSWVFWVYYHTMCSTLSETCLNCKYAYPLMTEDIHILYSGGRESIKAASWSVIQRFFF